MKAARRHQIQKQKYSCWSNTPFVWVGGLIIRSHLDLFQAFAKATFCSGKRSLFDLASSSRLIELGRLRAAFVLSCARLAGALCTFGLASSSRLIELGSLPRERGSSGALPPLSARSPALPSGWRTSHSETTGSSCRWMADVPSSGALPPERGTRQGLALVAVGGRGAGRVAAEAVGRAGPGLAHAMCARCCGSSATTSSRESSGSS